MNNLIKLLGLLPLDIHTNNQGTAIAPWLRGKLMGVVFAASQSLKANVFTVLYYAIQLPFDCVNADT
ncbi:hypothetical protein VQL36_08860 [Chengkuizengella sp. SCS-71B]|uniref:hypothetical protein n=1 Tax=Chengkuizengella sp. SCS-71B TaxID=3115290 RepID=UPI0032C21669